MSIRTEVERSIPGRGEVYAINFIYNKVSQLLPVGQWFSLSSPVNLLNKTGAE